MATRWLAASLLALGAAGCMCPSGRLACDGQCVDPTTDPEHCGGCGFGCSATHFCDQGRCVPTPVCGPRAASPVACDDADRCNGTYECFDGQCVETSGPQRCVDGVACTVSVCEPATGTCRHTPDDTLCDEGMVCDTRADCVTPCPYSPCSVVQQCGCAANQTCSPDGGNAACSASSFRGLGQACERTEQCAMGLVCLALGTEDSARCSVACAADDDCDGLCFRSFGQETRLANGEIVGRCEQVCDPVSTTSCGLLRCDFVLSTAGGSATFCREAGRGGDGSSCTADADCTAGRLCVRFTDRTACGRVCHGDDDCYSFERCRDFTTPLMVHGERIGLCQ
ncbi:MAG: hypothetical protein U0353_26425 [Sandaracinus sp.]